MLPDSQRSFLWEATERYRQALPDSPADAYLSSRGLAVPEARQFGLGYVKEPARGHEIFRGRLAIPYMRFSPWRGWSVASIRFRSLDQSGSKYMTVAGDTPRLYNTRALTLNTDRMVLTEGEADCITAELCGLPAVGVPGVQTWKPYYRELFLGYREVSILADGDEPGVLFANTVAKALPNARVIQMPQGQDVNSLVMKEGKQSLLTRL
jgi:DNA primase